MYTKEQLAKIIKDQQQIYKLPKSYIQRDIEPYLLNKDTNFITILSGIRRAGKSTLLLKIKQVKGGDYYVNFDDDRLADFALQDFQNLYEVMLELFGDQEYFYFDEIQNVKGWERFIRRLHDWNKKIYITGSNANLLSPELGTHLTGRYLQYTLYPLSFREFLVFNNISIPNKPHYLGTMRHVQLLKLFKQYLDNGGFPGFLAEKDYGILKLLYENVIYKDIIARYNISNIDALEKLARYSMSNFSRYVQFSRLANMIHVKNVSTVSNYFKYLSQSYLLFLLYKYEYSIKKQYNLPKKLYVIDTGLAKVAGFSFSENVGHALENTVFLHLKRRQSLDLSLEIYYFNNNDIECDFVLERHGKVIESIQVTTELTDQNKQREITGLLTVMKNFKLKEGTIVTLNQQQELKFDNLTIHVVPAYLWLLE